MLYSKPGGLGALKPDLQRLMGFWGRPLVHSGRVVGKGPGPQTMTTIRGLSALDRGNLMATFGRVMAGLMDQDPATLMKQYMPAAESMLMASVPDAPNWDDIIESYLGAVTTGRRRDLRLRQGNQTPAERIADTGKYAAEMAKGLTNLMAARATAESQRAEALARLRSQAGNLAYNMAVGELRRRQGLMQSLWGMIAPLLRTPRETPLLGERGVHLRGPALPSLVREVKAPPTVDKDAEAEREMRRKLRFTEKLLKLQRKYGPEWAELGLKALGQEREYGLRQRDLALQWLKSQWERSDRARDLALREQIAENTEAYRTKALGLEEERLANEQRAKEVEERLMALLGLMKSGTRSQQREAGRRLLEMLGDAASASPTGPSWTQVLTLLLGNMWNKLYREE